MFSLQTHLDSPPVNPPKPKKGKKSKKGKSKEENEQENDYIPSESHRQILRVYPVYDYLLLVNFSREQDFNSAVLLLSVSRFLDFLERIPAEVKADLHIAAR